MCSYKFRGTGLKRKNVPLGGQETQDIVRSAWTEPPVGKWDLLKHRSWRRHTYVSGQKIKP